MASQSLLSIPLTRIDGSPTTLADYAGKVMLLVNVASQCGFTPQYAGLEALHREFRDRGFVVLGFPSNDFGAQEPGTETEIAEFCTSTYAIDFPMHSKIKVIGDDAHPLYAALVKAQPEIEFKEGSDLIEHLIPWKSWVPEPGEVIWNFEKFLLGRNGTVLRRFGADTEPGDAVLREAIEAALAS